MVTQSKEIVSIDNINRCEIARQSGYTVSHVSRIFSGQRRPSLRCATKLARIMGLTLDDFQRLLPPANGGR